MAVVDAVELHALITQRVRDPFVHGIQSGARHVPFRRRGLVGHEHECEAGVAQPRAAPSAAPGHERDVLGPIGRLEGFGARVPHRLVDHAVAVDEHRLHSDSHLPSCALSRGWETIRCHTTAWKDSTCGVSRSGGAGTTTHASATRAVSPSGLPTIP